MSVRVLALAGITVREAIRSRFLVSMLVLLSVVNMCLPLLVRGDGTLAGTVEIMLRYTLGTSSVLLSIASLWVACGSVSLDIQSRRMHHVMSKPVLSVELWLGKWLGLVVLNGILLGGSYLLVLVLLQVRMAGAQFEPEERADLRARILQPHMRFVPPADEVDEEVNARFRLIVDNELIPDGVRKARVRETLARRIRAERSAVAPGGSRRWDLRVPKQIRPDRKCVLDARVIPPQGRLPNVVARWEILRRDARGAAEILFSHEHAPYENSRIDLPPGVLMPNQAYIIQFVNLGSGPGADTTVFAMDSGVAFLQPRGCFGENYLVAMLMQWLRLAAVCAFGLLCGTCLSFPVASFSAAAVLCVALIGHAVTQTVRTEITIHGDEQKRVGVGRVLHNSGDVLIEVVDRVLGPAFQGNPLPALAEGVRLGWGALATSAWILVFVYGGGACVLSTLVLTRRDLAVPDVFR